MILSLNCIQEDFPGYKWQDLFNKAWPSYRQWFLSEGVMNRKGYLSSLTKLEQHMPELVPLYHQLCTLAGAGDLEARFLSMYCPPPYMAGCSQMVCNRNDIFLIRNYDYNPALFEGNLLYTKWLKPVIGMSDCTWGLLDGMNADGLAASLAFGGRKISGDGFGIPLIIRYLLETASTVDEAVEKLKRIPVHMVYNVTLADAAGNYATVYVSPDRDPVVTNAAIAANHQQQVEWPAYAALTSSVERMEVMEKMQANLFENEENITGKFLESPLFTHNYEKNFGTLYTVNYRITKNQVRVHWPDHQLIEQSFDNFNEAPVTVYLPRSKKMRIVL